MVKIILYILLLSVIGIMAFFLFLNSILHRIFYHSPIPNKRTPADLKLEFKEIFIETVHRKKLQVFEIPAKVNSQLVFLCVHGWANTVDNFLEIAVHLVKMGNVYLLNTRNHGESDAESSMTIIKYVTDIRQTVDYIQKKLGQQTKIILLGHSLGGAAALLTAQEDKRISAVISISSFADMKKILHDGFLKSNVPGWFINSLLTYIEFRIGRSLNEVSPAETIKNVSVPVMLIHGTKDEVVEFNEFEKILKEARKNLVEKYVAKGHNHSSLLKDENVAVAITNFIKDKFLDS